MSCYNDREIKSILLLQMTTIKYEIFLTLCRFIRSYGGNQIKSNKMSGARGKQGENRNARRVLVMNPE